MPTYLSPGVYAQEIDAATRPIERAAADNAPRAMGEAAPVQRQEEPEEEEPEESGA